MASFPLRASGTSTAPMGVRSRSFIFMDQEAPHGRQHPHANHGRTHGHHPPAAHPHAGPAPRPDEQEADLALRPRFMAPDYQGSQKLLGRVALISGGDSGIGRAVAVLFAREGADVAVTYLSSTEDAEETSRHVQAEGARCLLLQGDVRDRAWCEQAVDRTVQTLGS